MKLVRRTLGTVWFAIRQLRTDRTRTALAICGVAIAVLSVTLLFGVGAGVAETGHEKFEASDRDLWVSGGPIEAAPGTVGGFRNPVTDAHTVANEIQSHPDVENAAPMAFQVMYVSTDGEEFDTIMGSGVPGGGSSISLEAGDGFSGSDTHRAGGNYDGEMTHQVIVDPETAERYDLSIGDTVYVGGTHANARANEFTVVGISSTFANFLGTETVTLRLSELQTLSGSAYDDRATLITVKVSPGADPAVVGEELAEAHPEYTFRTNEEQFTSVLQRQATILAGGLSLVVVGVLAGAALSLNLLLSLMYGQRDGFALLRAIGATRSSVIGVAVVQATVVAAAGCVVGLALTPPAAFLLESLAATVTGFEGLVRVPTTAYVAGVTVASGFAILGGAAGAWRVGRMGTVARVIR